MSIVTTFGEIIGKDFKTVRDLEEWIIYGDEFRNPQKIQREFKKVPVTDENEV